MDRPNKASRWSFPAFLAVILLAFMGYSSAAHAIPINVCYQNTSSWTDLNGPRYNDSLIPKLTDPANFGPAGTFGDIQFTFQQFGSPLNAGLSSTCDIWFSGWETNSQYTAAERTAMQTFVANGGSVLAGCDDTSHAPLCTTFGATITNSNVPSSTYVANAEPIACPGDNTAGTLGHQFNDGYFSTIPAGAQVISNQTPNATNPTSLLTSDNQVAMLGDVNMIADGTLTNGPAVTSTSDYFAMRLFGALASSSQGNTPDCVNTLPVTLNQFESRQRLHRIDVTWQTATETFTVGFNVWADVGGEWVQLNNRLIRTRRLDSITPQRYRARLSTRNLDGEVVALALTSVDFNGYEEGFGPFAVGERYGSETEFEPVPWADIQAEFAARMAERGLVLRDGRWVVDRRGAGVSAASSTLAHVGVREDGMVRVTYEQLLTAGVDFASVRERDIAISFKGRPVPRRVLGPGSRFGPGSTLDFYGEAPKGEDALYLAESVYQIRESREDALNVQTLTRRPGGSPMTYLDTMTVEEDNSYANILPTGDPFLMAFFVATGGNGGTYPALTQPGYSITVEDDLDPLQPAFIELNLAGISNPPGIDEDGEPGVDPDHAVEILVNDQPATLENPTFEGYGQWIVRGELAPGVLQIGDNALRIRLLPTGYTQSDIVALDSYAVHYHRPLQQEQGAIEIGEINNMLGDGTPRGYTVEGFDSTVEGYAFSPSDDDYPGNLIRLRVRHRNSGGLYQASIPTVADPGTRYVLANPAEFSSPFAIYPGDATLDVLSRVGDYLLIVHPNFLPDIAHTTADDHPLIAYVEAKELEGYTPQIVSLDDIVEQFGFGMQTPTAITRYLNAARAAFDYQHVLLVGGDVYDYLDKLGTGAMSFIPTRYAVTNTRLQYTPTDALIADLDNDEISDVALGRWPVRTLDELGVIVDKTLAFEDPANGVYADRTALLIAEEITPQEGYNFSAQMDRINDSLVSADPINPGGEIRWDETVDAVDRVDVQELIDDPAIPPQEVVPTARQAIIDGINQPNGQALTVFGGHGAPMNWSFSNLMTPAIASDDLENTGTPTLMMPMACYTTYYNEPTTDTLAHQLLLAGDKGAVAIHAAATLSGYDENEAFGITTLGHQLRDRDTLGQAVEKARRSSPSRDVRINWTLLGDPTLRLE